MCAGAGRAAGALAGALDKAPLVGKEHPGVVGGSQLPPPAAGNSGALRVFTFSLSARVPDVLLPEDNFVFSI